MEVKENTIASESHHWYMPDGTPYYTCIGANGKERPTTLRDARKVGAVPSVTTILKQLASPGLERWKLDMAITSALTLPRIEGETEDEFKGRVEQDWQQTANQARELGTAIHGSLELALTIGTYNIAHKPYVDAVLEYLNNFGITWEAEKSFATHTYGGKVDLYSKSGIVIDFKTTEFTEDKLPKGYPEQKLQLAAYAHGLGLPKDAKLINLFISTNTPGLIHAIEHIPSSAYEQFDCLLNYWRLSKGLCA